MLFVCVVLRLCVVVFVCRLCLRFVIEVCVCLVFVMLSGCVVLCLCVYCFACCAFVFEVCD